MGQNFQKGEYVQWNFGAHRATGQIKEAFKKKVTRTLKGNPVTRHASEEEPAYLIKQADGDEVLKSESELSKPEA